MNDVFIIGNGFDLDIGLKSRYSDFYNSSYWPFHGKDTNLAKFLESQCKVDKWLDIEEALAEYGSSSLSFNSRAEEDEEDFCLLKEQFTQYIIHEQETVKPKDCVASKLLSAILENGCFEYIYSFNFTDLSYLVKDKLHLKRRLEYSHVHGRASDGSAILGVGDYAGLRDKDDFMYKSFAKEYAPPLMIPTMLTADRVFLFGVSMGRVDYQYFDDFFKRVIYGHEDDVIGDSKQIAIFTYDEKSRRDILRNLQSMTGNRLGRLFARNYFHVYCTAPGIDDEDISYLIKQLKANSLKKRNQRSGLRYLKELEKD